MRLFTAIRIPESAWPPLCAVQALLRTRLAERASCSATVNFHITLKFLGETSEAQLPALCDALSSVPARVLSLSVHGLGTLPVDGMARAIVAGLSGQLESLHALFRSIERATQPLGFEPEPRDYHPHVTLARLRKPMAARDVLAGLSLAPSAPFRADVFELIHSTSTAGGSHYRTLARFALGSSHIC